MTTDTGSSCSRRLSPRRSTRRAGASVRILVTDSPPRGARLLPSDSVTSSAPTLIFVSGLNHTACSLAVYASRLSFSPTGIVQPRKTRFRLVVNLCRAGLAPARSLVKFPRYLHRFLLTQALPGAKLIEMVRQSAQRFSSTMVTAATDSVTRAECSD